MRIPILVLLVCFTAGASFAAEPLNYEDHVLPIFKQHCNGCHNPDDHEADLDLTTYTSVLKGSSGGEVVKAGVPDTSSLYEAIIHADDVEPMPPNKPKLADSQIEIVHRWIAGGLLEAKGGKSKLRNVAFNLTAGSMIRPENPAMPTSLPKIPLPETRVTPPILALAGSPWTNLIAASGHEQILLFGEKRAAIKADAFEPVAKNALVMRHEFEDQSAEGKVGSAWFTTEHRELDEIASDFLVNHGAFSFTAWLKPDAELTSGTIFGRYSFAIFLEKTRDGWRVRVSSRSKDNKQSYFGRVGEFPAESWQHVAVTCDGKEWAFYHGGVEVVRQPIPEDQVGFIDDNRPFFLAGDGHHDDRQYRGGLDDVRIYKRALTPGEVAEMNRNVSPTMATIGTLPFPEGDVHDLQFSRNGDLLVAAGGRGAYSGKVAIFDVRSGQRRATIADEQDIVLSADISADHRFVAIGTPSKKVKLFSAQEGQLRHTIDKHTDWVTKVRFSPDGTLLATGDRNGGIHIWESENAGIVYTLSEHKARITGLSWRADGKLLASAGADGKFVLWDMKDGWPTRTASPHVVKQEP
ncbi:MAG: LamG-like jellyroll fold domain-containing protein, partial [Rubripirellula sp.]